MTVIIKSVTVIIYRCLTSFCAMIINGLLLHKERKYRQNNTILCNGNRINLPYWSPNEPNNNLNQEECAHARFWPWFNTTYNADILLADVNCGGVQQFACNAPG